MKTPCRKLIKIIFATCLYFLLKIMGKFIDLQHQACKVLPVRKNSLVDFIMLLPCEHEINCYKFKINGPKTALNNSITDLTLKYTHSDSFDFRLMLFVTFLTLLVHSIWKPLNLQFII